MSRRFTRSCSAIADGAGSTYGGRSLAPDDASQSARNATPNGDGGSARRRPAGPPRARRDRGSTPLAAAGALPRSASRTAVTVA